MLVSIFLRLKKVSKFHEENKLFKEADTNEVYSFIGEIIKVSQFCIRWLLEVNTFDLHPTALKRQ